jgi:hypothetical protein
MSNAMYLTKEQRERDLLILYAQVDECVSLIATQIRIVHQMFHPHLEFS